MTTYTRYVTMYAHEGKDAKSINITVIRSYTGNQENDKTEKRNLKSRSIEI